MESVGALNAEGLVPQRFERAPESRRAEVTRLDAARAHIEFDGSADTLERPAGLQDRLSWWLQIAAIAGARELQAGMHIEIEMLGLHHDVLRWDFEVVGPETLDGIGASWHLRRAAIDSVERAMDVWLAPEHHWLPVRLVMGDPATKGSALWLDDVNEGR